MNYKLVLAACIVFMSSSVVAAEQIELKTQKDKLSYAIGMDMGNSMKRSAIDTDPDIFMRGLKDALAGSKTLLTEQQAREVITAMQKELQRKQKEKMKLLGENNKKEGEVYLAANKQKKGVKVLPSGLQYTVIKEGTGKTPKASDTVTVNYKGTLINGTEFDSSYKRGQPATFPVNGVIKGWTEALQLMKEGAIWQLVIPSDLAYGERGAAGGTIGPNSVLVFEVELISVKEQ
jgi:FKBP-type peptidyl-prolyl cis-trans isomerase FklB